MRIQFSSHKKDYWRFLSKPSLLTAKHRLLAYFLSLFCSETPSQIITGCITTHPDSGFGRKKSNKMDQIHFVQARKDKSSSTACHMKRMWNGHSCLLLHRPRNSPERLQGWLWCGALDYEEKLVLLVRHEEKCWDDQHFLKRRKKSLLSHS